MPLINLFCPKLCTFLGLRRYHVKKNKYEASDVKMTEALKRHFQPETIFSSVPYSISFAFWQSHIGLFSRIRSSRERVSVCVLRGWCSFIANRILALVSYSVFLSVDSTSGNHSISKPSVQRKSIPSYTHPYSSYNVEENRFSWPAWSAHQPSRPASSAIAIPPLPTKCNTRESHPGLSHHAWFPSRQATGV